MSADDLLADVRKKLAVIRGESPYDAGWRHALQWVLETYGPGTPNEEGGSVGT